MDLERAVNRRQLARMLAGGALTAVALPLLSACGNNDNGSGGAGANPAASVRSQPQASATGETGTATVTGDIGTPASTQADPGTGASPAADPGTTSGTPVSGKKLAVYSGRNENLIGPLLDEFKTESGIDLEVRYGDSAELAALILEEGNNSPADIFFAQDAGSLGAVAKENRFATLPDNILNLVDARFRSDAGLWIGVSGRARAVVYNTDKLSESDIPASILDFTDVKWKGKLGWAPTNGSFQAFITALRLLRGDAVARGWLEGIKANGAKNYQSNDVIVQAVVNGEVEAGFVNHYYLLRMEAEAGKDLPAANFIYKNGDPGALVNAAGIGILQSSKRVDSARALVEFLFEQDAQQYFAEQTWEYPLAAGVTADPKLTPLADIQTPAIDLSNLSDLEGTLTMLRDVGVL